MRFLYGSRYREATEQAVSNFKKKDQTHRAEQDHLKKTVYSLSKLKPVPSYKEPSMYPDLRPKYAKGYFPSKWTTNMGVKSTRVNLVSTLESVGIESQNNSHSNETSLAGFVLVKSNQWSVINAAF